MALRIYNRIEWGAKQPTRSMSEQYHPPEAFVHYSASPGASKLNSFAKQSAAVRAIQDYHQGQGWADVGYHYIVCQPYFPLRKARVFRCRNTMYVPAAQAGHNTGTIAICVIADGSNGLKRNTRYAIEQLLRYHGTVKTVGGHRDVVSTSCPGDKIYAALPTIARASGKRLYR